MFSLLVQIIYYMSTYGSNKVQGFTCSGMYLIPYLENIGWLDEAETLVGGL